MTILTTAIHLSRRRVFLPTGTRNNNNVLASSFFRSFSSSTSTSTSTTTSTIESSSRPQEEPLEPRDHMAFDVLIVGGGPAGLAAAIKLKQLCVTHDKDLSVCVIEKGNEIGAHILSGNVFDPRALQELFCDTMSTTPGDDNHWATVFQEEQGSFATPVVTDTFSILNETGGVTIPNIVLPSQLHNDGNYIISLGQLCKWLAVKAEDLGVEIYPGFSASEVLVTKGDDGGGGGVIGIATRDVGIGKDGTKKTTFERGVELHARQTLFAEGARGSCSEFVMETFNLRKDCAPQTYALGIKEVWEVPDDVFQKGLVQHTLGFPLQSSPLDKVFGGSFLYHQEPNLVLAGLVVGLDYANPYLNPYKEFQKWKTHPAVSKHLKGGTCISYGARVLNEGGYHSIPKVTFPGGALVGCAAGFLNAVKIKGSHTALKSGMLAAEAVFDGLQEDDGVPPVAETGELDEATKQQPKEFTDYSKKLESSWIYQELYQVRNCHEAFSKWGVGGGLAYSGFATHITKGKEPWTLSSHDDTVVRDADTTESLEKHKERDYPAPDGKLTFDLLTNLQRSGTFHEDDQPSHLRIKPDLAHVPKQVSLQTFGGPEQRFCPAGVYEYVHDNDNIEGGPEAKKLVINAQNCIHCKCCSIKMPQEYIDWTVPEGGGGPQYQVM